MPKVSILTFSVWLIWSIFEFWINRNIQYILFCSLKSIHLLCSAATWSIALYQTPYCIYPFYWVTSTFALLQMLMNICIHFSWVYIKHRRIAGSWGKLSLRSWYTSFPKWLYQFTTHQQCCSTLVLNFSRFIGWMVVFNEILICFTLITNVEYLFICLIGHLEIFFCEVHLDCLVKNWSVEILYIYPKWIFTVLHLVREIFASKDISLCFLLGSLLFSPILFDNPS